MKKLNKATLILICSLLLLALSLAATFSWFPRAANASATLYHNLNLNASASLKSVKSFNVQTFKAELDEDGDINPVGSALTGSSVAVTVPAKGVVYFQTSVDKTAVGKTDVSLTGLSLTGAATGIQVCCVSPLQTKQTYSDGMTLIEHIKVEGTTPSSVIWYLYNSGSSDADLTVTLPTVSYAE